MAVLIIFPVILQTVINFIMPICQWSFFGTVYIIC